MIKIQYASDLHLEFPLNSHYIEKAPLKVCGDILVLAGDIAYLGHKMLDNHPFFDWCSKNYRHTYIVPGNHEFYDGYPIENANRDWEKKIRGNVSYINNKSVRFDELELFFTTLWTPLDSSKEDIIHDSMNDFSLIRCGSHRLTPDDYNHINRICVEWLDNALRESDARHKIVVSHHCPCRARQLDNHPGSLLVSAFMAPMTEFIVNHPGISHWIFGHTHYNGDMAPNPLWIGDTRLLCNQLGYVEYGEGAKFNASAILNWDAPDEHAERGYGERMVMPSGRIREPEKLGGTSTDLRD